MSGLGSGRTQRTIEHAAKMASDGHTVAHFVHSEKFAKEAVRRLFELGGEPGMFSDRNVVFGPGSVLVMVPSEGTGTRQLAGVAVDVTVDHHVMELADANLAAGFRAGRADILEKLTDRWLSLKSLTAEELLKALTGEDK